MKFKLSIFLVFFSFILSSKCSSQATFFDYDLKNFDNFDVEEYDYGFDSTFTVFYKQQNPIFFNEVYIIPKKAEYKFVLKNSEDINKFFITFDTLSKNNTFQNGGPAYKTTSIFQDSIKRYFKELKKKYNDNSYFRGYSGDEELLNEILKQQLIFLKKLIEENQLIYNDKPSFLGSTTHTNIEWNSKEGLVIKIIYNFEKIYSPNIFFTIDITNFEPDSKWELINGIYSLKKENRSLYINYYNYIIVDEFLMFPEAKRFQFTISERLDPEHTLKMLQRHIYNYDFKFEDNSPKYNDIFYRRHDFENYQVIYGDRIIDYVYHVKKFDINIFWKKRTMIVTIYNIDTDNSKEYFK